MFKAIVGLAEYKFKSYKDTQAEYELIKSVSESFPLALYLDEPQGEIVYATLPEFLEYGVSHIYSLGHLNVYSTLGQEVEHYTWE